MSKPGEEVVPINVGWMVDKFVEEMKEVKKRICPNGKVKKAAPKMTSSKTKKTSKPAKTLSQKGKKAKGKK